MISRDLARGVTGVTPVTPYGLRCGYARARVRSHAVTTVPSVTPFNFSKKIKRIGCDRGCDASGTPCDTGLSGEKGADRG